MADPARIELEVVALFVSAVRVRPLNRVFSFPD